MGKFMKRLALVLATLTLGACAAEPQAVAPARTAPAAPQPKVAQAPGGEWQVVEDYAAQSVGLLKSPYLGGKVVLDAARAVDAAGRLCKAPQYLEGAAAPEVALGHPAQPQSARETSPRRTVMVTCDGTPFATLVSQPDGGWLMRQDAWVLKLAKAVTPPPQPHAEAPAPAPVADAAKPAPKPDPRTLVYLASYPTEARAKTGYKVLTKVSPLLAANAPITQAVDLGKKGKWVRLYGLAASEAERKTICSQLGKHVDECGARNRE